MWLPRGAADAVVQEADTERRCLTATDGCAIAGAPLVDDTHRLRRRGLRAGRLSLRQRRAGAGAQLAFRGRHVRRPEQWLRRRHVVLQSAACQRLQLSATISRWCCTSRAASGRPNSPRGTCAAPKARPARRASPSSAPSSMTGASRSRAPHRRCGRRCRPRGVARGYGSPCPPAAPSTHRQPLQPRATAHSDDPVAARWTARVPLPPASASDTVLSVLDGGGALLSERPHLDVR